MRINCLTIVVNFVYTNEDCNWFFNPHISYDNSRTRSTINDKINEAYKKSISRDDEFEVETFKLMK